MSLVIVNDWPSTTSLPRGASITKRSRLLILMTYTLPSAKCRERSQPDRVAGGVEAIGVVDAFFRNTPSWKIVTAGPLTSSGKPSRPAAGCVRSASGIHADSRERVGGLEAIDNLDGKVGGNAALQLDHRHRRIGIETRERRCPEVTSTAAGPTKSARSSEPRSLKTLRPGRTGYRPRDRPRAVDRRHLDPATERVKAPARSNCGSIGIRSVPARESIELSIARRNPPEEIAVRRIDEQRRRPRDFRIEVVRPEEQVGVKQRVLVERSAFDHATRHGSVAIHRAVAARLEIHLSTPNRRLASTLLSTVGVACWDTRNPRSWIIWSRSLGPVLTRRGADGLLLRPSLSAGSSGLPGFGLNVIPLLISSSGDVADDDESLPLGVRGVVNSCSPKRPAGSAEGLGLHGPERVRQAECPVGKILNVVQWAVGIVGVVVVIDRLFNMAGDVRVVPGRMIGMGILPAATPPAVSNSNVATLPVTSSIWNAVPSAYFGRLRPPACMPRCANVDVDGVVPRAGVRRSARLRDCRFHYRSR